MPEMTGREPSPAPAARGRTAQWVIVALLALIAAGIWRQTPAWLSPAQAQQPLAGARGIFAFTGPLDRDQYGLFMLDVDQGTIWCYGFETAGGARKLRLIAARTWIYDRYLQDFNCAEPGFRDVQTLVAQQREHSARPAAGDGPDRPAESPGP